MLAASPQSLSRAGKSLKAQRGALMVLVLLILLVVSMLGMSTMDATGLEMQMSSNSREQQQVFEAAEYTLSYVENQIQTNGFSPESLQNATGCGAVCFDATCSNGYCFDNSDPLNDPMLWDCQVGAPATEMYESADVWDDDPADGSDSQTLAIPATNMVARYIVEFRCYAAENPALQLSPTNLTPVYRITAFVIGESGRTRVMLRSTMKDFD
jgi:type IV pilus assembly protein PilX